VAACPPRPSRPACRWRSAWLRVTATGLRAAPAASRARGTLPWMAAISAVRRGAGGHGVERQRGGQAGRPATAANGGPARDRGAPPPAAGASRRSPAGRRQHGSRRAWCRSARPPASAAGVPPIAAQPCVGSPAWLMASLPHGKPPHGQRSRNASAATHHPATASGQQRRLSSSRWATANTAKMSAEAMASATQANQATLMTQDEQREEEREAEDQADRERAAQRAAVQGDDQQRRAEPPRAARRRPARTRRRAAARCPARRAAPSAAAPVAAGPARAGGRSVGGCNAGAGIRVAWLGVRLSGDHLRRVDRDPGAGAKRATLLFTVNMAIRCVIFSPANTQVRGGPFLCEPFPPNHGGRFRDPWTRAG
jgi:hypothetical protein